MYILKELSHSLATCIWHAVVERDEVYTDPANEYWSLGFARRKDDSFSVELYGPSLQPRMLAGHKGEEYWGIEFRAHVMLHAISKGKILHAHMSLPTTATHFSIGSRQYPIPKYDELETFMQQLQEDGVIIACQRIYRALQGESTDLSERSRQRHVKNVTGLTKKQIEQLQRARHAFYLLQRGNSPAQAALAAGYADQSHMTRSLKLLRGETPAQIIATHLKHA